MNSNSSELLKQSKTNPFFWLLVCAKDFFWSLTKIFIPEHRSTPRITRGRKGWGLAADKLPLHLHSCPLHLAFLTAALSCISVRCACTYEKWELSIARRWLLTPFRCRALREHSTSKGLAFSLGPLPLLGLSLWCENICKSCKSWLTAYFQTIGILLSLIQIFTSSLYCVIGHPNDHTCWHTKKKLLYSLRWFLTFWGILILISSQYKDQKAKTSYVQHCKISRIEYHAVVHALCASKDEWSLAKKVQ